MEQPEQSDLIIPPYLKTEFTFRQRPMAIPADLRPGWRIGLLVMLLKNCCRDYRSSFARLQVLSWGLRTPEGREQLVEATQGRLPPSAVVVRYEPFLNQALDYARGEGLIRRERGDRVELTELGLQLAIEIEAEAGMFRDEKAAIAEIKMRVTETLVDGMFGGKR